MPKKEVTIIGAGRLETQWFYIRFKDHMGTHRTTEDQGIYSEGFKKAVARKAGIPLEFLIFEYFTGADWIRVPVRGELQSLVGVRAKIEPEYVSQVKEVLQSRSSNRLFPCERQE